MTREILGLLVLGLCAVPLASAAADMHQVTMKTSAGTIGLELDASKAPKTVANFIEYAKAGFYEGTIFHRVIPGFMIQGGGYGADFKEKPTRAPIQNEAANGLKNTRGSIAMARTGDPHSASAQFFINVADNDFLNHTSPNGQGWGYAVFGRVTSGMDVVDKIEHTPTGSGGPFPQDVPQQQVVIEKVTIDATPTKTEDKQQETTHGQHESQSADKPRQQSH
jgi:peptidyl-prolyl cis-trans isomerase B (cyclophilin B)